MRRIYPLIITVFMLTICLSGCLGSENNTEDDLTVDSIMQMMIDEGDFPANWHKGGEGIYGWPSNVWLGQDFRESAYRGFTHYYDNITSIDGVILLDMFSFISEEKAIDLYNHRYDSEISEGSTVNNVNLGDDGFNHSKYLYSHGYFIRVGLFCFSFYFSLSPGSVEYEGWSEDIVKKQVTKIRELLPFWPGYEDPVCHLEIEADSLYTPSNVTFIMKASEGDGAIANWSLDIDSDGIPEYSGEGQPPQSINRTYEIPVTFKATLWVTDVQGDQANSSDGLELKMINKAPMCSIFALPDTGEAPLMVTFSIHVNDPNDDRVYYEFDIDGDGKIDYNGTIWGGSLFPKQYQHIYETPGEYHVYLSVSDGRGGNSSASATIIVT